MKSKEKIIIEETGCSEELARQSLKESGDNIQKAVKHIASNPKYIRVLKGKFVCPAVNVYGLFSLIINQHQSDIIRRSSVITSNPAVYESDLEMKWNIFEKHLYALRLHEGSLHETTSIVEQDLTWQIKKGNRHVFFQSIREGSREKMKELLKEMLSSVLSGEEVNLRVKTEDLTLNQLRELSDEGDTTDEKRDSYLNHSREIMLDTELMKGNGSDTSIPTEKLKERDLVFASIVDSRDTAQYLSRLLGGRVRDEIIPLTVTVEKIKSESGDGKKCE